MCVQLLDTPRHDHSGRDATRPFAMPIFGSCSRPRRLSVQCPHRSCTPTGRCPPVVHSPPSSFSCVSLRSCMGFNIFLGLPQVPGLLGASPRSPAHPRFGHGRAVRRASRSARMCGPRTVGVCAPLSARRPWWYHAPRVAADGATRCHASPHKSVAAPSLGGICDTRAVGERERARARGREMEGE